MTTDTRETARTQTMNKANTGDSPTGNQLLVRVDYELPPTRGIMPMYFAEDGSYSDEDYKAALRHYHGTAIIRGITRNVNPETEGCLLR